jgi:hypothetical protein
MRLKTPKTFSKAKSYSLLKTKQDMLCDGVHLGSILQRLSREVLHTPAYS